MTKKWVTGPTQEIVQHLADQISDLRGEVRELDLQIMAHQYAVQALLGSFVTGGAEYRSAIMQMEAIRDGQRKLAAAANQEGQAPNRKAFNRIADHLDEIVRFGRER